MFVSDIVKRVRNISGDISALQFTDSMLIDWINDGIMECADQNSLLQKSATSNTAVGTGEYDLPTDIFKLYSVYLDSRRIRIVTRQEWEELYAGEPILNPSNSPSTVAFIWGTKLSLYPFPDQIYPLKINYIYDPTPLATVAATDGVTKPAIPSSYHLRLVTYVLAQIALQDQDVNTYQLMMSQFSSGIIDLRHQGESEEALYPFISVATRDMGSGSEWTDF